MTTTSPHFSKPAYRLVQLTNVVDARGKLTAGEFGRSVPFQVKRYFMVYQVPLVEIRGGHAHRQCHQFLVCARGKISVIADDGKSREEFLLDRPDLGLYLPPMVWGIQYKYSPDSLLIGYASDYYDANDYIRNYDEFRTLAGASK